MPNQYVNKVVQSNGTTLIDISDTTAVAADVTSGKYFYLASGERVAGTGQNTPSATSHTIYFEFSDGTDTTLAGYWDSQFVSDAILATTPSTYGQKTVDSASLDGVEWYTRPTETWEVLLDDSQNVIEDTPYNLFWLTSLSSVYPAAGEVWRITVDGTTYLCTAEVIDGVCYVGNPKYSQKTDNGSSAPFSFYNRGWGALVGDTELSLGSHALKIERQVTA